ncbi:Crp/Fnr family transcriptional regulator [Caulobacter sp. 1776]|uniref:Crp/Fnr family transcriptional regulator n=1 Tax=Caulobacter sp. 1776 TaxID=3156420 RepID=UPI0033973155
MIASLDRFGPLRESVRERLSGCSLSTETFESGALIVGRGERSHLRLLARGLAVKQTVLGDGARQIFGLATPGDLIDLGGLFAGLDFEVRALGACEVRKTTPGELKAMVQDHPGFLAAVCRAVLTEARAQRNWMVSLGRRSALSRTANLLCEVYWRQKTLALAEDGHCALPAVQSDLADALGLSVVHIHRVLRVLRDDGLARLRNGVLQIQDWDRLAALGDFEPAVFAPQSEIADHGPRTPTHAPGDERRGSID